MYTILINADNSLTQSIKEPIMHRESNVHTFRFLVDPIWIYNGVETDMRNYTCILEYRTPISERYAPVVLTPSAELYKDKLEYIMPITTKLTAEVGELEMKFIFTWVEMTPDGKFVEHSRKTSSTAVTIIPVEQWSDYIANSDLDNLAQIMMQNQAQIEQNRLYAEMIMATKADGVKYDRDTNILSLISQGVEIDSAQLEENNCDCEDGVPVVDFTIVEPGEEDPKLDNVIEF